MSFLVLLRFLGNYYLLKLYLFTLSYSRSWNHLYWFVEIPLLHSVQAPDDMLREAKHAGRYFKYVGNIYPVSESRNGPGSAYRLLTEEEIEVVSFNGFLKVINYFITMPSSLLFTPSPRPATQRDSNKPKMGRWYFPHGSLEKLILTYPWHNPTEEILSGLFSTPLFPDRDMWCSPYFEIWRQFQCNIHFFIALDGPSD